ncbi:hypothetical protein NCAS_0C04440 [Naumovozyma castellii]|uniref:Major facilitator superfamily (MFS) profile domain-containing protein n=1 Tax=Naumovozyma castellii TaxID=27288 RepID=G0VD72_NAUCA|nr:hypothetical protein NCAS_0C04440 [Naumovozyma castellii CBS 4309]CCC69434.1 hypothetical protein NCAS_0C04440 [Naumovozyma castellii CBS 4309]
MSSGQITPNDFELDQLITEEGNSEEHPTMKELNASITNSGEMKNIMWKDQKVKVYALNYKEVPLVKYQIVACMIMFLVFGFNDQATGSLLPTLTEHYKISTVKVSNIFLLQLFGYTLASLYNETLHRYIGMRGGMITATALCLVFFGILASKPRSFYVYMFCCLPLGLALGIVDSIANVFIGNLVIHKNEMMGIMHSVYGAAAMLTPPLVAHFVEWGHWSLFFLLPVITSFVGMCFIIPAFRFETEAKYDYVCAVAKENEHSDTPEDPDETKFLTLIKNPIILLNSIFLFIYLGAEISTGSWFFSFLLATKSTDKVAMSYIASAYWIGFTLGRLVLGFATDRFFSNQYKASRGYGFLTLFWYTIFVIVGAINYNSKLYFTGLFLVVFFCGFFMGPLFPNASIVTLQILPGNLHIPGISLAVAIGGCGGAALPYMVGVITHLIGIEWTPLLCWIMVAALTVVWASYPRYIKGHDEFL